MKARHSVRDTLLQRVYSEFLEIPGLRLTNRQAQRLWGIDEETCTEILEHFVANGFLDRQVLGIYTRVGDGNGVRRSESRSAERPRLP
jgi:hypothetical protein